MHLNNLQTLLNKVHCRLFQKSTPCLNKKSFFESQVKLRKKKLRIKKKKMSDQFDSIFLLESSIQI